jgi:hypothetical protein
MPCWRSNDNKRGRESVLHTPTGFGDLPQLTDWLSDTLMDTITLMFDIGHTHRQSRAFVVA